VIPSPKPAKDDWIACKCHVEHCVHESHVDCKAGDDSFPEEQLKWPKNGCLEAYFDCLLYFTVIQERNIDVASLLGELACTASQ
jgi:hypothetical protein